MIVYNKQGIKLQAPDADALKASVRAIRTMRKAKSIKIERHFGFRAERVNGLLNFKDLVTLKGQLATRATMTALKRSKRPRKQASQNYIGIEVECFYNNDAAFRRMAAKLKLGRIVNAKDDGSIRGYPSGYEPAEFVLLTEESKLEANVRALSATLEAAGALVNKSCGLHVHIDMRHRDAAECYRKLYAALPLLYAMVPKSRAENDFCKPNRDANYINVPGRYWGINPNSLGKHNTLEVRLHSGTTQAYKIIYFVQLLLAIVNGPMMPTLPLSKGALRDMLGVSEDLAEYVFQRIREFDEGPRIGAFDYAAQVKAMDSPLIQTDMRLYTEADIPF